MMPSCFLWLQSFSEALVKFMEKESTPEAPAVRLPVDAMARDSIRHHGVTTSAQHVAASNQFQTPITDVRLTSASQPSFSARLTRHEL